MLHIRKKKQQQKEAERRRRKKKEEEKEEDGKHYQKVLWWRLDIGISGNADVYQPPLAFVHGLRMFKLFDLVFSLLCLCSVIFHI